MRVYLDLSVHVYGPFGYPEQVRFAPASSAPPPEAHRSILKPATKLSVGTSKPRMPTYSSFYLTDGFCGAASY